MATTLTMLLQIYNNTDKFKGIGKLISIMDPNI